MRARTIGSLMLLATTASLSIAAVRFATPALRADGTTMSDAQADGKANYEEYCRKCHGVRGTPPKTMKEKFSKIATFDAKFVAEHSVDSIVKVLTKGKNEDMKSFKDKMSTAELTAVAQYVHELQKAKP